MNSIKNQPWSDTEYSRRISESRSSHARGIRRTSTYGCALHGDRVDGTDISSTRHDARTRLYTHAVACNHALRGVVMLPSCVRFLFPRSREKFAKSPLWTTAARTGHASGPLRGRGLRNPASRYLLSAESIGRFFPGRPDYALIRRSSGSRITPRDRYRQGGCQARISKRRILSRIIANLSPDYLARESAGRLSMAKVIIRPMPIDRLSGMRSFA